MQIDAWTAFYIVAGVIDVYAITTALTRRLGVESTLAWIFAILALPGVGGIAYVMLAGPSIKRTTKRKRKAALAMKVAAVATADAEAARLSNAAEDGLSPGEITLLRLAATLTDLEPTGGNEVELLAENEFAFQRIAEALRGAKRTIWAESYIIQKDETGERFLDGLIQKARDGVEVRLLYDAVGSFTIDAGRLAALHEAGGKASAFLPVNPLRKRWAVNLRNHRKLIIVDGKIGFTGGMNIGNEYSGSLRRKLREVTRGPQRDHFQDAHLRVVGPAVAEMAQTFAEDWSFATDEELKMPRQARPVDDKGALDVKDETGSAVVAVIPSGPDQVHNANAMVYFAGISSARQRIWLESAYFIPNEALLTALVSAALRGVDVRVIVPAHSDAALVRAAARSYYPALVRGGVRVFEYQPSMLHSKTIVIDSRWGLVGSANMDIRSFRLNFELSALVMGRAFAADLESRFEKDQVQSIEITAEMLSQQGYWAKLRDGLARLMSPLL